MGVKNRYEVGVRNMAWSSDFPHHGCDWPYSRKIVGEMLAGVPREEKELICAGNMIRIYNLPTRSSERQHSEERAGRDI